MIINTQMMWVFGEESTHIVSLLCIRNLSFCHPIFDFRHGDNWQTNRRFSQCVDFGPNMRISRIFLTTHQNRDYIVIQEITVHLLNLRKGIYEHRIGDLGYPTNQVISATSSEIV